ncbi:MAG: hypothetical protein ACTSRW_10295 [Candidatus Helarchaeota archaeon]
MSEDTTKFVASDIIKRDSFKSLYKKTLDYLVFQLYSHSKFIYEKYGMEALEESYLDNQQHFFDIKMSKGMKVFEGIIKKLPKGLKIKEGLKYFIDEMQFMESPSNIVIHERSSTHGVFEITRCTIRRIFNKYAKKDKKDELIDKCCVWCQLSTSMSDGYGLKFTIELTKKGCMNYLE